MDSVGGAKILSERFAAGPEPAPLAAIVAVGALPLFHWAGVEPGAPAPELRAEDPRGRRRRRFRLAGG